MKISVAFLLVFVSSIFYCSFGNQHSTSTENNEVDPNTVTLPSLENATSNDLKESVVSIESKIESSAETQNYENAAENSQYTQQNDFLEIAQNSGVAHEITSPSLDIIHTLADTATLELQDKADELSIAPTILDTSHTSNSSLEDNFIQEANIDKDVLVKTVNSLQEDEVNNSDSVNQTEDFLNKVPSTEPKINITAQSEEIPSFSEWTQKQLEEAERKKEEVNASVQNQFPNGKSSLSGKKRWKNYASPDCGAKIVAANPEAVSAGSVLTTSRDEYKLNTCNSRIWFVVELCEAIQAKKIDLANFELFSSSPKDFSISVSDRFTTRDWLSVGHFTAKDERDIQSFDLHPHLFGKFMKFEMHSHHGSEHYCPISLFRVYGTSEFEVLETETRVNAADDDDDDETLDFVNGDPPKNLFSSATDAVISIVKKAAEALGNKGNRSVTVEHSENKTSLRYLPLVTSCTTPSHMIVCENCTDLLFGYVFELLSCKSKELASLVKLPFIKKALYNSNICLSFGLDLQKQSGTSLPNIYKSYLIAFFSPKYIAAMCNTVAISECRVVLNVSHNATLVPQNIENIDSTSHRIIDNITFDISTTETLDFTRVVTHPPASDIPNASQIKPTKTLTPEDSFNVVDSSDIIEDNKNVPTIESSSEVLQNGKTENVSFPTDDNDIAQEVNQTELNGVITGSDDDSVPEHSESLDDSLDTLVNEISEESTSIPATTVSPPTLPQQQKETVFLRLSNRLKALELNMSLSGQYLEELSRRYKKQVEEMQRLLDKTILALNEDNIKKEARAEHLEQQIYLLKQTVESLMEEKNSWANIIYWLIFIVTFTATVLLCKRSSDSKEHIIDNKTTQSEAQRRKSIGVVTHKTPKKKKRRPSEEALLINGTYTDLLIDNDVNITKISPDLKKRKRRKNTLFRSNSFSVLPEENLDIDNRSCQTVDCATGFDFAPKLTSSRIMRQPEEPELRLSTQRVENSTYRHNEIMDVPLVLEESEHSSLEPLMHNSLNNIEPLKQTKFTVIPVDGLYQNSNHNGHKKTISIDNFKTQKTSPLNTETSLNGSLLDESLVELPRREKRNFLKKIFKNLNLK